MVFKMAYKRYKKYNNIKTKTFDGNEFDSKKEAKRWTELKLLERAGEITNLQRQVTYLLIPAQYETIERYSKTGKRLKDATKLLERECSYIADFVYTDKRTGQTVVEDVKGYQEGLAYCVFKIKRKLMLYIYKIRIKET